MVLAVPPQRELAHDARHLHAGDLAHLVGELLVEAYGGLRVFVLRVRERKAKREQVLRLEAGVHVLEVPETLHQEPGAHHEQECEGDLAEDERHSRPGAAKT